MFQRCNDAATQHLDSLVHLTQAACPRTDIAGREGTGFYARPAEGTASIYESRDRRISRQSAGGSCRREADRGVAHVAAREAYLAAYHAASFIARFYLGATLRW
jgi:hypothetical protein